MIARRRNRFVRRFQGSCSRIAQIESPAS
jgi:hypothetical protein